MEGKAISSAPHAPHGNDREGKKKRRSIQLRRIRYIKCNDIPVIIKASKNTQVSCGTILNIMEHKIVDELRELSKYLLANPELAFKEYGAHEACIKFLKTHCGGWKVTPKAYGLDTAWEAVYTQGEGGRRVVFCSEYDALPDVGHACNIPM